MNNLRLDKAPIRNIKIRYNILSSVMKNISMKQHDDKDEKIADALIALGMSRSVARTLSFLQNADEATAVELEKGAGLHQPEVSIAMKELKERGWIVEREEKKPGQRKAV